MKLIRHLLQYVHGRGARSCPAANMFTSSGFAISGRPIETPSTEPSSIARAIVDCVWKPPAQITGTDTDSLKRRASARLIPSIPSRFAERSQAHLKTLLKGGVRNIR